MKKSVKWLIGISIVWVIASIFMGNSICNQLHQSVSCMSQDICNVSKDCTLSEFMPISLFLDIPAVIFLIVGLFLHFKKS